jgi:hypothetical protein
MISSFAQSVGSLFLPRLCPHLLLRVCSVGHTFWHEKLKQVRPTWLPVHMRQRDNELAKIKPDNFLNYVTVDAQNLKPPVRSMTENGSYFSFISRSR